MSPIAQPVRTLSTYLLVLGGLLFTVSFPKVCAAQQQSIFDPEEKSLTDIQTALKNKTVTSEGLVEAYLYRIALVDKSGPTLNSVLALNPDALRIARELDNERTKGNIRGPLHGIPVLLKDNIESLDPMPTTAGSLALKENLTGRDAPIVSRLREAGAIILGKTNLSEWANIRSSQSSSGWSAVGGLTRNPYALTRNTCGSSSGSAAAIAASLAVMSVGTETDGSITCPAAVNGIVGFKPTVGLLSQQYIIPISHSQDTAGPMTRSVYEAAVMLTVMATNSNGALSAQPSKTPRLDYTRELQNLSLKDKRIGILKPLTGYHPELDKVFTKNIELLKKAGAVIVEIKQINSLDSINQNELTVLLSELKYDLNDYLKNTPTSVKTRSLDDVINFNRENADLEMPYFGQELFEAAQKSMDLQSAEYKEALLKSQSIARAELDRLLKENQVIALIAPTTGPAWKTDLLNGDHYSGSASTLPAVAGYPHLTVPMGDVRGMPVGLSIITGQWQDREALQIGYAFEQLSKSRTVPGYLKDIP